jgi:cell division protein FtsZ
MSQEFESITFDLPKHKSNVIKVIGIGGGGGNAINHMYREGINGVDFVICNTDRQALENSPVPNKIQLGVSLTEGLGAGANPEIGEQAALESLDEIKNLLETNTKMVFITAGMGGGTGTGAAPVIAGLSKDLGILTVGIVTIPFKFEGNTRHSQAQKGIDRLRACVDSLIVINNNKLREIYGNLGFKSGFGKADEVLATAAKGIAEVITHHYLQNIDLRDAKTVLSNSGTAIMGASKESGENRAFKAISNALDSPLLNDNKIKGAKNVLLLIVSGTEEITLDEIGEINDYIQQEAGYNADIIMGVGEDESLGDQISVTVIATGFDLDQQDYIVSHETQRIIHSLDGETETKPASLGFDTSNEIRSIEVKEETVFAEIPEDTLSTPEEPEEQRIVHTLDFDMEVEEDAVPAPISMPETEAETFEIDERIEETLPEVEPTLENEAQDFAFEFTGEEATAAAAYEVTASEEVVSEEITSESEPISTEALRAIEVDFEAVEVTETLDFSDEDFTIIDTTELLRNIEVVAEEVLAESDNAYSDMAFELPLVVDNQPDAEEKAPTIVFDLNETFEEDTPKNEVEEAHEAETVAKKIKTINAYELDFDAEFEQEMTLKTKEEPLQESTSEPVNEAAPATASSSSPYEMSLSETQEILAARKEQRLKVFKEFNHQFNAKTAKIEDFENVPAYKRAGVSFDEIPSDAKVSRTTLGDDSNGNPQIRSNNSFLHDNVD